MSSTSSKRWLYRQSKDPYVRDAQAEGYPSRAAYKLLELNAKDHLFKPGAKVVDLGAAPGGWSVVAKQLVGQKGRVIALDLLPMQVSAGIEFIQGDFTDDKVLAQLLDCIDKELIDLVISDMAPNITGCKSIDQPRAMHLAELAWDCAQQILKPGGHLLIKLFQGAGTDEFVKLMRKSFKRVVIRKPKASRADSAEIYMLAYGFN